MASMRFYVRLVSIRGLEYAQGSPEPITMDTRGCLSYWSRQPPQGGIAISAIFQVEDLRQRRRTV